MIKGFLFALLFIVLGLILFSLLAPLLFHGANMRAIGAASFPVIVMVCGVAGFVYGRKG
jgi:NADH:ubiquinone oxidoreductase subunit 3 (subunit A)